MMSPGNAKIHGVEIVVPGQFWKAANGRVLKVKRLYTDRLVKTGEPIECVTMGDPDTSRYVFTLTIEWLRNGWTKL